MADPALAAVTARALARLEDLLRGAGPTLHREGCAWLAGLGDGAGAAAFFLHPRAFPILALPWFAEQVEAGAVDPAFQEDLALSTACGYLSIRLVDDAMDEPGRASPLLAAIPVLQLGFEEPYLRLFPEAHPMRALFRETLGRSAEATLRDALLRDPVRADFESCSAAKTCAARLPLLAALHRHGCAARAAPWLAFLEAFSRWHQLENDVFDWRRDLSAGRVTWFLAEARRRAAPGQDPGAWALGPGLAWAFALLDAWWDEVLERAAPLASAALMDWAARRRAAHLERRAAVIEPLARLRALLAPPGAEGP